ncbi:aldose 1-epimerase [Bacillus swezeyi]|uniref:Aldose epimerase n=1 Tax=Bacillus swezeyi TaxID=1925020 RepID=A0A1R1QNA7_9BACI|nr:aldose 1-epimerase [Bacillus swezeyi]MEC1261734.1 aldose 1-epimerase [Bacillus swezeyi]MED2926403.1 aldose 1-epimerase [Bacillus swezeyi]MED2943873.1 aldose 1-epimerase [Bacillus swezeyi]MED2966034.1 aldose 1-epimerase [Bacillus swezeyi]MED2978662.1 aldose 1-epimerase [Bacillus swezeyi]
MSCTVEKSRFLNEEAILLTNESLEALLVPGWGSNLISLKWKPSGLNLLKTPETKEEYDANPYLFGIPILFPPNRIDHGRFTYEGKTYQLPINEKPLQNHLHGFLNDKKWTVKKAEADEESSMVQTMLQSDDHPDIQSIFPHSFSIVITYRLKENHLEMDAAVVNHGTEPMPLGLGYHTSFRYPFNDEGDKTQCLFSLPASKQWVLSDRLLPTGELRPTEEFKKGRTAAGERLDDILAAELDQEEKSTADICDRLADIRVQYQCDKHFKHWVVFNGKSDRDDLLCLEPYTWVTNAPNLELPRDVTGFEALKPQEEATMRSKIIIGGV